MSDRHKHPAASFNLPVKTREQLRRIAAYYGLGSETQTIVYLAMWKSRAIEAVERKSTSKK